MLEITIFSLLNGLVYGLMLFLLASGLTLIFSMMGVLNFAHASFYMLGAYISFSIAQYFSVNDIQLFGIAISGYWIGLFIAPIVVGVLGALIQRYALSYVHRYGHVPELIFTFSLAFLFEEIVSFIWGRDVKPYNLHIPESLQGTFINIANTNFPTYKVFMLVVSILIFISLLVVLKRTRVGLIIQAAITHPNVVGMLGHNVPLVFMSVFGVGTLLAGIAGVIAGPVLTTSPAMGLELGSIIFVVVVFGGLGSLAGAFIASLIIGVVQTFATVASGSILELFVGLGWWTQAAAAAYKLDGDGTWMHVFLTMTPSQVAPLIPYLMLVLILIFRPLGLMGNREV